MTFRSRVADIKLESRADLASVWLMSLDETEFRPGDTGSLEAMTRTGTRLTIAVLTVTQDDEGVVWHTVRKPLAAGTDIAAEIDRG